MCVKRHLCLYVSGESFRINVVANVFGLGCTLPLRVFLLNQKNRTTAIYTCSHHIWRAGRQASTSHTGGTNVSYSSEVTSNLSMCAFVLSRNLKFMMEMLLEFVHPQNRLEDTLLLFLYKKEEGPTTHQHTQQQAKIKCFHQGL